MNLKTFELRFARDIFPESVPPINRLGATTRPSVFNKQSLVSHIYLIVPCNILKALEVVGETMEGSRELFLSYETLIPGGTVFSMCEMTSRIVSPGKILTFRVTLDRGGRMLFPIPPDIIVGVIVVRVKAFKTGTSLTSHESMRSNNQVLARIVLTKNGVSGAKCVVVCLIIPLYQVKFMA